MQFPFLKQLDSMGCGSACIGMICRFYGLKIPYAEINGKLKASSEGVSILGIERVLGYYGFESSAVLVSEKGLPELTLPTILHWNQNHFVVLYRITKDAEQFYIADPGKGKSRISREEFLSHWASTELENQKAGVAISIIPGNNFIDISRENKSRRSTGNFLNRYFKGFKNKFFKIALCLLLGCVLQLILPFLTQSIVDVGIHDSDIGFIWLVLLGELMIITGRTLTDFLRKRILLKVSMKININMVRDFFIKLLKLPMSFFDTKLMGDLLQRISDHSRVQTFLSTQCLGILFSLMSFVVFGAVLLIYNGLIFSVFILGSVIYGLWLAFFLKRRKIIDYELFEQQSLNQQKTYQFVTSMQEIKLQNCENRRLEEWENTQTNLFGILLKALQLQQSQETGSVFINEIKNIIITVLAATTVINGQMSLGAMLAIQYIIGQLNSPVNQLMAFIYSLQDVKISLERINEVHCGKDEESDGHQLKTFGQDKGISLKNVCFRYNPDSLKPTIDSISLEIPEGKTTAIVGASGSGKTTLIKLMLGYYPLDSGNITISGKNINDYNLKWWRKQCGVVMQEGVIFSESIERNIAVGDEDVDKDRLEEAARTACIHNYVESLPLGYNTIIGREGAGLSQGQKQRILIARAVYKKPDFIFLDEATNSLDAQNERCIVENLSEFYRGRTVIVVAHRLSTVKDADNIVVLDKGRIVEQGTHAQLIELKKTYYNLVKNQLELGNG